MRSVEAIRCRALILIQASSAARCSGRMAVSQHSILQEGAWMNCSTQQHQHYCGIDLHARPLYVCILDQSGTMRVQKNLPTPPDAFLRLLAPYRDAVGVAVECICPCYWLADLWSKAGIAFVLGQALSMTAIEGGKA